MPELPGNPPSTLEDVAVALNAIKDFFGGVYTVATIPPAKNYKQGAIILVTDGAAGAQFRGNTGSAWVNLG